MEKLIKNLLIIGAGREQIKAYQIAKKMDLFVIGTDINPQAPAFEFADVKLNCSTRNAQETLDTVLEYAKVNSIDGVMTVANDVPYTVALVAEKLKLPSITVDSAKIVSNKALMKKCFEENDIPTPKYQVLYTKDEFSKKIQTMRFPLILKPSDGRGSRGVLYLDSSTDLSWAWEHSLKNSENKILILEEYIDGDQLSVEGIFYREKYCGIAFADRNYNNLKFTKPFVVEDGGAMPSKHEGKILNQISQIIANAANSVGIKWGTVKGDIVLSQNGPIIIELAARLSGNYLSTHDIPMTYGVDIVSAMIKTALGFEINESELLPKHRRYLGTRYFFPSPGKIKQIEGIQKVKSFEYVKRLEIYRQIGDIQPIIDNHSARAGTITCEGSTYEQAVERVNNAANFVKFVIDPNFEDET